MEKHTLTLHKAWCLFVAFFFSCFWSSVAYHHQQHHCPLADRRTWEARGHNWIDKDQLSGSLDRGDGQPTWQRQFCTTWRLIFPVVTRPGCFVSLIFVSPIWSLKIDGWKNGRLTLEEEIPFGMTNIWLPQKWYPTWSTPGLYMDSTKAEGLQKINRKHLHHCSGHNGGNIQSFECSQISGVHQGWNFCTSMPRPERQYFLAQEFERLLLGEAFFCFAKLNHWKILWRKRTSPKSPQHSCCTGKTSFLGSSRCSNGHLL